MKLHHLLEKQLERAGLCAETMPAALCAFVERVNRTYEDADIGRYRLERSIVICAEEMSELARNLEAERDRIRAIFESVTVGITQARLDGELIECNDAYARMVGLSRDEVIGHKWLEFVHPDERDDSWASKAVVLEQPISFERRYIHKSGKTVWAHVTVSTVHDANGEPVANIAVQRDITAQRELEISLRHAQKLEAVGRLAAGVAHEINTPLQFVGDNLAFLSEAIDALLSLHTCTRALVPPERAAELASIERDADLAFLSDEAPRAVKCASDGVAQMSQIVRAMKVLAHREHDDAATLVDLNGTLTSVAVVARSETKFVADVALDLGQVPLILAFSDDLGQVFLNLLVNAAHAVGDKMKVTGERGRICVSTKSEGDAVVVTISDTGSGIPQAIRGRIFEPFFTTKEVGRGTGQGLALARAVIVDKHRGELTFDSELGAGTTFRIRLAVGGPAAARRAA